MKLDTSRHTATVHSRPWPPTLQKLPLLKKFTALYSPCQHLSISQQQTVVKPWEANWSFKPVPWCDLWCIYHMLGWLCPSLQGYSTLRSTHYHTNCTGQQLSFPICHLLRGQLLPVPLYSSPTGKEGEGMSKGQQPFHCYLQLHRATCAFYGCKPYSHLSFCVLYFRRTIHLDLTQTLFVSFIYFFKNWRTYTCNVFPCICLWIIHKHTICISVRCIITIP